MSGPVNSKQPNDTTYMSEPMKSKQLNDTTFVSGLVNNILMT